MSVSGSESSSSEIEEDLYEVEKILNQKEIVNDDMETVTLYQIKWKDYDESYISWEPIECLTGCEQKLEEFNIDWARRKASGELDRPPPRPSFSNGNSARNSPAISLADESTNGRVQTGGTAAALKSKAKLHFSGKSSSDEEDDYDPKIEFDTSKKRKQTAAKSATKQQKSGPKSKATAGSSKAQASSVDKKKSTSVMSSTTSSNSKSTTGKSSVVLIESDDDEDISARPKCGPKSKTRLSDKAGPPKPESSTSASKPKPKIGPKSRLQNGTSNSRSSSPALSTGSKSSVTSVSKSAKASSSPPKSSLVSSSAKVVPTAKNAKLNTETASPKPDTTSKKTSKHKVGPKSRTKSKVNGRAGSPLSESSLFLPDRMTELKAPSPPSEEPPFELMEMDGQESDAGSDEPGSVIALCQAIQRRDELEKCGPTESLVVEDIGSAIEVGDETVVLVRFTATNTKVVVTRDLMFNEFPSKLGDYYIRTFGFSD